MQPQFTDAETTHRAQMFIIHPTQYALLGVALAGLFMGDKAGAATFTLGSLVLEKTFQGVYNLVSNAELSASFNLHLPKHYSIPTKVGLTLFSGVTSALTTAAKAFQSSVADVEQRFNA